MLVVMRNPRRELELPAPKNVAQLLRDLDVVAESVIVIRNDELVTKDATLHDADRVEIRPVMSGGARREVPPVQGAVGHRACAGTTRASAATASSTTARSRFGARSTTST